MTTRNKISEQIERLFVRSFERNEALKPIIERREIELLVDQVANSLLAAEPKASARVGVVDVPACMIATYRAVKVLNSGGRYYSVLPAFPIRLPLEMGVVSVSPEPSGAAMLPIRTDFWDLLSSQDEGLLEDQIGYIVEGREITYTEDPAAATVKIKLYIVDPSLLDKFDPYPVTADQEAEIIQLVLSILTGRNAPEKPKG